MDNVIIICGMEEITDLIRKGKFVKCRICGGGCYTTHSGKEKLDDKLEDLEAKFEKKSFKYICMDCFRKIGEMFFELIIKVEGTNEREKIKIVADIEDDFKEIIKKRDENK